LEIPYQEAEKKCIETLSSGAAKEKLAEMIAAQGGDASYVAQPEKFPKAEHIVEIRSEKAGYLSHMDAEKIGLCAGMLGAGRMKKEDAIDHAAGIILAKKTGDFVKQGDVLVTLHTNFHEKIGETTALFCEALTFSATSVEKKPLIQDIIR
jgi:pyrimidine-nucleoside phosphorylase